MRVEFLNRDKADVVEPFQAAVSPVTRQATASEAEKGTDEDRPAGAGEGGEPKGA